MKKMYKDIIFYIIFFVFFFLITYFITPITTDEIWNFGFSHNVYSGLIPYKDFNVVLAPFYFFVNAILFRVFTPHVVVMYLFSSFMATVMVVFVKKINSRYFYFSCLILLLLGCFFFFPSYNLFCLYLFIVLFYLQSTKKYDFLVGLIIGIIFITKQSIGVFLAIPILFVFFQDKSKFLKQLVGFIIPVIILFLYFVAFDNFYEFVNYCFLGLFDFSAKNSHFGFLFIIELFIVCFLVYKMIRNKSNFMDYLYLLCFQIMSVPLFDIRHCILSFVPIFIYFINSRNSRFFGFAIFSVATLFAVFSLINHKINTNSKYFTYRNFDNNILSGYFDLYDYLENYYENYEVYLISYNSYIYKLENSLPIHEYDLLLYGNLGYDSYNRIISSIANNDRNIIFIVSDIEYKMNDQLDDDIIKYIYDNSVKVDKFYNYDIYKYEVNN